MLRITSATSTGLVRAMNEDRISVAGRRTLEGPAVEWRTENARQYALIADGMGGHAKGEVASDIALTNLEAMHHLLFEDEGIEVALRAANRAIYETALSHRDFSGMGTTIVGVAIDGQRCHWFNVGDSRAYLLRGGRMSQISKDHVPSRSVSGRYDHSITQSLGGGRFFTEIFPSLGELEIADDDRILLCTDGLSDLVHDTEIEHIVAGHEPTIALDRLIARCFELGAPDNISLALIRLETSS